MNLKIFDFFVRRKKKILEKYWFTLSEVGGSCPMSIILDCVDNKFEYLHRGTNTLAFRLPFSRTLRDLLNKTGPLIAPSANPEALFPAKNIKEARRYFGDVVDPVRGRGSLRALAASNGVNLYIDGGEIEAKASKLIKLNNDGSIIVLRE